MEKTFTGILILLCVGAGYLAGAAIQGLVDTFEKAPVCLEAKK